MARPRKSGFFAWSDLYNGGEVGEIDLANGGKRTVMLSRNIVRRGEPVSEGDFSKEDWSALIEGGSVRPYPVPEEADDMTSPAQAVMARLTRGTGEIDPRLLMQLAMQQPLEDEASEVPEGA